MAGDTERLVVSLEARIKDFERNMQRASKSANDNFGQIERRGRQAGRNLETALKSSTANLGKSFDQFGSVAAGKLKGAFAAVAAGVTLNELRKAADSYTKIMNSLKVAGIQDSALPQTFDQLFASAQRNAAPLDALATLYGRVSAAQTTLKASTQEVMTLTDLTAQSLRVGGTSAQEASGALLQLGQALAGGKVQSEEYNSLLDGMRPLLEAAAAGMKEAGGDVAKLTALVKDGKVSSEAFFRAILAGGGILEDKLVGSVQTTEQALQRLSNEFVKAVGELDKATGASQALAGGINTLAGSIGGIGAAAAGAVNGVQALINKVAELAKANAGAQRAQALSYQDELGQRKDAAREMGTANAGGRQAVNTERQTKLAHDIASHVENDINSAFDIAGRQVAAPQPVARPKGLGAPKINPISLADYAVPGDAKGGGGGGGGGGAEKQNRYEREIDSIRRRTEALQQEAAMVGKSTFETEKSKIALALEQAAKRDNIAITDQMRSAIDQAATGFATAKVKVEDLKNAFDGLKDAGKFIGDQLTDGLADMVLEGKSATEVVNSLGKALLKAALQAALMGSGPLAGLFGGAGGGGILGFIPKLFGFADGGYTGDGGKYQPKGIVHGGEFVMSKAATNRIGVGNLDALHRGALKGYAGGGFVGAAPLPAMGAPSSSRFSSTTTNTFSPTIPITVQASGNKETDSALAGQLSAELDTLLENKMAEFASKEQRSGGMFAARRFA